MYVRLDRNTSIEGDPLLQDVGFDHEGFAFPYGFPLRIRTNAPDVLAAAQESWGDFRSEFDVAPVELSIGIAESSNAAPAQLPVFRAREHLLFTTADAENTAALDFRAGIGFGWFTAALLENREYFRFAFLEALGYSLICERHLAPIHAACVALHGKGLLLCGASEAGKSSLAYACAQSGWEYIADDGSFLVREHPNQTVIGNPHRIRLRPSARELFPELSERLARVRPNGKLAIEIPTRTLPRFRTVSRASVERVVFLNRNGSSPARLSPVSKEEVFRKLETAVKLGDEQSQASQKRALASLLREVPLELQYSDLPGAIDCLTTLMSAYVSYEGVSS